jgi:metal-dependent HD superfamily phosphatase/phosphodiesterase
MPLKVSTKKNAKLVALLEAVNADLELQQLWAVANVNAMERLGMSDHGGVHIQIVANACVKILRLLVEAGVDPSVVSDHGLTSNDAEVVVVLAACLHDVGMSVHRDHHETYSLIIAYPKARQLLATLYDEPELTTMTSEVLHAVIAHRQSETCLTLEAGVLKVADALDMTEGRSRIPFEAGEVNIHAVSAQAVSDVSIHKGRDRPVHVEIKMNNSSGIFQVDELLKKKLASSSIARYVEVSARIEGEGEGERERRLLDVYKL